MYLYCTWYGLFFEPAFVSLACPRCRALQPICAYTCLTQDAFDHYQGDQFQNFDQYAAAHFNTQPTAPFPGPPTPPNHQHPAAPVHHNGQAQLHHGAVNGGPNAAPAFKPPQQPDGLPMTKMEPNLDADRQASNSADEEDLTPAQSRRKAQNRAA